MAETACFCRGGMLSFVAGAVACKPVPAASAGAVTPAGAFSFFGSIVARLLLHPGFQAGPGYDRSPADTECGKAFPANQVINRGPGYTQRGGGFGDGQGQPVRGSDCVQILCLLF